jgi:hypothetical protein
VITSVFASGGFLSLSIKLDAPAGSYRIEFFKNPSGVDPSTFGEGEVYAGSQNVTHPGGGAAFFSFSNAFAGAGTDVVTATATACTDGAVCAAFGSTSESAKALAAHTTAVTLMSFAGRGADGAVDLSWTTASELSNLGFHLYRSTSADGPFTRITSSVIPGLGSSPAGGSYSYRDSGLTNGATYYYKLEDVDLSGVTTPHGPVSARPAAAGDDGSDGSDEDGQASAKGTPYGDPGPASLTVLERDSSHVLLELRTGGFYARANPDGTVDLSVPGFDLRAAPGDPALPSRHAWIETTAGRKVRITRLEALDRVAFRGLRPAPAAAPSMDVSRGGIVRPGVSPRRESAAFRRGPFPAHGARLLGTGFQGETKKAEIELCPLRFNPAAGQILLSRRLRVRVEFTETDAREVSLGGTRGRRPSGRVRPPSSGVIARLAVRDAGVYKVPFTNVLGSSRALSPSTLSLARDGQEVAFHVDAPAFGPGSSLYFYSPGAATNPDVPEIVYELRAKPGGVHMGVVSAAPSGSTVPFCVRTLELEQNKTYQSGLLEAPSLWLWEALVSPVTKSYPFTVDSLADTSEPGMLGVWLQGASDFDVSPDHHVRVSVNGIAVAEASWDGKKPRTILAALPAGVLVEGANTLSLENVGDTNAAYSMVLLDRFSVSYPRRLVAADGVFEGNVLEAGAAEITGLGLDAVLLDTTGASPRWLAGAVQGSTGVVLRAEAGHRYLAVSPAALRQAAVRRSRASDLRSARNRADYLIVGPRDFLDAARPLLDLRENQGLAARAVAIEDVYDQFAFGEASADALRSFLAFAFQSWQRPSVRYVLLLGDATYDPKDYLKTGVVNRIPAFMVKTSYLWTASDPAYAAVNGDDALPDVALGRLPAETVDEARIMVDKIVAFETSGRDFSGEAVLVADNADVAGNFEGDADDVASSTFASRRVEKLYVRDLGGATRSAIQSAFDTGPAIVNYIGHGGIAVWASENIWNNLDVNSLAPQPQQPLLFTMNCLNGYFHFPSLNSLAEQFLKAEAKGAVAAFAPSGLSVNDPAHHYHELVLAEITSGRHGRLGDAVLAAQNAYAQSGDFPELLSIYHLFGDPALRIP